MAILSSRPVLRSTVILLAVVCFYCGKDSRHTASNSSFTLFFRTTVGGVDLHYDSICHGAASRAFTVTDFRYYLSAIRAVRADGSEQQLPRAVVLVDPGRKAYDLGTLPKGDYKGLRFIVGLDSAINHGDPTVFGSGDPLAIQTPGMHWDWNSGYLFMKVEGRVDTTKKGTGQPTAEFFYHIGMDRMERTIDLPVLFSIGKAADNEVRLRFDLAALLGCIAWPGELSTHSFDNMPLAKKIADHWQGAFSVDK